MPAVRGRSWSTCTRVSRADEGGKRGLGRACGRARATPIAAAVSVHSTGDRGDAHTQQLATALVLYVHGRKERAAKSS
jgi:hypothetical protein